LVVIWRKTPRRPGQRKMEQEEHFQALNRREKGDKTLKQGISTRTIGDKNENGRFGLIPWKYVLLLEYKGKEYFEQ